MKRFLGCVLGILLVVAGGAGIAVEYLDQKSNFIFFGYVFASLILLGGILLIWASLARYGGGLWSGIGYLVAAAGIVFSVSMLDDYLRKIGQPTPRDVSICSIICMLGAGFLVQGHNRHRAALSAFAAYGAQRRSKPLVPVWLGCLLSGLFIWHSVTTDLALKRFVESCRRDGLPMDFSELRKMSPAIPLEQNAAVVYLQAFTNLVTADGPEISRLATNLVRQTRISPEDLKVVAELTKRNRKALDLLHRGATFSQSGYGLLTNESPAFVSRQVIPAADCGDLLVLEVVEHGAAGNPAAAVESALALIRLGDSLAKEPSFGAQNRRGLCNAMAFDATAWLLQAAKLDDQLLAKLASGFRNPEQTTDYRGAYLAELCETLQAEPSRCIDMEFSDRPFVAAAYKGLVVITDRESADKLYYGENTLAYLRALKNPYPLRLQILPDPNKALAYANHHGYFISAYRLAWRNALAMSQAENCARLRVVQAALALERHRLATGGELPQRLTELAARIAPTSLEDPFDGYPLRYSRLSKGYVIYSVGKDKKDNGGQPRRPDQAWMDSYDIAIRVQHAEPTPPASEVTANRKQP
jgi:hypothetical protein